MTQPKKVKAIERLRKALEAIPELKRAPFDSTVFEKWRRDTKTVINHTFGEESSHVADFMRVDYIGPVSLVKPRSDYEWHKARSNGLDSAASVLESMIGEIQEFWEGESPPSGSLSTERGALPSTKEVFVIHGRDNEVKQTVARFLEKIDLKPVILHESPDLGRTVIEKFEQHAEVGFAVALLTPDDVGSLYGEENNLKPRARQNVIFEFGYFIGRLGRQRVCALTKGNVEIPSDYAGVLYIPLDDAGGWKMRLITELKTAGYNVDANRAFQT